MTESSYDSFHFPPSSSSSFPCDPTAFYQDHHPGYPQPDELGLGPPPPSQTDTINLNKDYQNSYPYQYTYNPTISPPFDTQQPSTTTVPEYILPSSSPISSIPLSESYQPYPPYLLGTSSSIPPSSPTEGSLPEVANFPSQSFESTISNATTYPLMVIREGQSMERGYKWPIAGPSSLEGKMQDMHLHNGNGNGMWHMPCEMKRGQSEVANQPSYNGDKSFEMLNSTSNIYPASSGSSLPASFSPPTPQYGENPTTHLWDTSSSQLYTTSPTQPTTFTSTPTWQSYSYHSPTSHEYRPPPILPLGHQHRYTSSSPTLQGYKPAASVPLTTSFSLPTPVPSTPAFVVRPSLDMLTSKVVRSKRRLPTPPRITGWIPPEQRPLPSSDVVGEQGRPRLIPVSSASKYLTPAIPEIPIHFSPSHTTPMSSSHPIPSADDERSLKFDTCLPQIQMKEDRPQTQDTFAFAMSYTSDLVPVLPSSEIPQTSSGPMPSSNLTRRYPSAKRDLLTRTPFPTSGRPGSEPVIPRQRGRPRSKAGNKSPTTSVMGVGSSRRWRIEQKLAMGIGKRFMCPDCDEPFTRRNDLERHQRSKHTGETPFICPGCEKGFSRKDKLDQHIEKVPECKAIAPPREERIRRRNNNRIEPSPDVNLDYRYDPKSYDEGHWMTGGIAHGRGYW